MSGLLTIILNPTAGKGRARSKIGHIKKFLTRHDISHQIILTEYPGHAAEIARDCAQQGKCRIVAAGGDGTCHETANGLLSAESSEKPLLGVLPVGSGNDFSFGSSLPLKLEESLQLLRRHEKKPIDAGFVRIDGGKTIYFLNGMGIGFDARVSIEAGKMKHLKGSLGYIYGAVKMLMLFPDPPKVEIEADGHQLNAQPHLISCMIGKRLGGSFLMAPRGDNRDGLFDVYITEQFKRLHMIRDLLHFKKGLQDRLDDTKFYRVPRLRVSSPSGGLAVHADGENLSTDAAYVEAQCLPSALNVMC